MVRSPWQVVWFVDGGRDMHRYELSDPQWARIASLFPDPTARGKPGRPRHNEPRTIVNGILWILHTGAPWRDLPERYGPWQTVFDYFNAWRRDGIWNRVVTSLLDELDDKGLIDHDLWCIDGSVIRASRVAAGAKKKGELFAVVGRPQGGATPGTTGPCARAVAWRLRDESPSGLWALSEN